ncbi:MAG: hypothetical protein HRT99_00030, partial [Mycoplasmatales bacterium]|nr:hypothetical protein [Mycoplasmatales bacterium]
DMKLFDSFDLNNLGAVGGREYIVYPVIRVTPSAPAAVRPTPPRYKDFFKKTEPKISNEKERIPRNYDTEVGHINLENRVDIIESYLKDWIRMGDLKEYDGTVFVEHSSNYLWATQKIVSFKETLNNLRKSHHKIPLDHINDGASSMTIDKIYGFSKSDDIKFAEHLISFIEEKIIEVNANGKLANPKFAKLFNSMYEYDLLKSNVNRYKNVTKNYIDSYNYSDISFGESVVNKWKEKIAIDNTRDQTNKWNITYEKLQEHYDKYQEMFNYEINLSEESFTFIVNEFFNGNIENARKFKDFDEKLNTVLKRQASISMGVPFNGPIMTNGFLIDIRDFFAKSIVTTKYYEEMEQLANNYF